MSEVLLTQGLRRGGFRSGHSELAPLPPSGAAPSI